MGNTEFITDVIDLPNASIIGGNDSNTDVIILPNCSTNGDTKLSAIANGIREAPNIATAKAPSIIEPLALPKTPATTAKRAMDVIPIPTCGHLTSSNSLNAFAATNIAPANINIAAAPFKTSFIFILEMDCIAVLPP